VVQHLPGRVSVILPVYRLAPSVAANIERTVGALAGVDGTEIIVVDDGSDDGTLAVAQNAATTHPNVTAIGYPDNAGKGSAIRAGFEASRGGIVIFLDGDLDLPPEQLPALIAKFEDMGVDALVGSKRDSMKAGGYPWWRRTMSRLFSWAMRFAFRLPVSETQTGLKLLRREPLERLLPQMRVTRYAYDIELLVLMHRHGYRLAEIPVTMRVAQSGTRVRPSTLWEVARDTTGVWFRSLRRRAE